MGSEGPRTWTLRIDDSPWGQGAAVVGIFTEQTKGQPLVEVIEKSAYDAAVDQAAIAQNHRHKAELERDRYKAALEALVAGSSGVVAFNGAEANNRFYKAREAAATVLQEDKP